MRMRDGGVQVSGKPVDLLGCLGSMPVAQVFARIAVTSMPLPYASEAARKIVRYEYESHDKSPDKDC
jgi:hypothetical protein